MMSWDKTTLSLKRSVLTKLIFTLILTLLLVSLLAGCGAPTATTQALITSVPATTHQASTSSTLATTTTSPTITPATAVRPQGELVAAINTFGNENWLPWLDAASAPLHLIVYDLLIYWDTLNSKFLPGLAESWENSSDGLTLIYHLRKDVQWQDGWGEFTSADIKFNLEMHASPKSIGKATQCRKIASMDTPDPYTLIVHFKEPYPTFFMDMGLPNSAVCQGIVCKKYFETVGEEAASKKPVGTGPWKLVDSQLGSYMKFEAPDSHWRVVPEFKYLTVRLITETSTLVASLKTKEIDMAQVPAENLPDLKAAGLAVEASPVAGSILILGFGGMIIPEDKRYDSALHNKDPWTDVRVRKAMNMAIDREAICKAIYAGYAEPVGIPLFSVDMNKYRYPYDPAGARQLLKDAGYPNGFSFRVISYKYLGATEAPRLVETVAGYWQQIGLDPKITATEFGAYTSKNINPAKTAGDIFVVQVTSVADMLSRIELSFMPNATQPIYQDAASYAMLKAGPKSTFEERGALLKKFIQYYFDYCGPIPLVRAGYCFAWNSDKILPWPHSFSSKPIDAEYVRHARPLNTYRLWNPWPDR